MVLFAGELSSLVDSPGFGRPSRVRRWHDVVKRVLMLSSNHEYHGKVRGK